MKRALLCVCLLLAIVSSANVLAATAIQKSTLPGPGLGGGAGDGT